MSKKRKNQFSKEDAYQTLEMINTWIGNMDMKVSFALALVGILVCNTFGKSLPKVFLKIAEHEKISQTSGIEILGVILVGLLYVSSFICIVCFVLSLTARIKTVTDSVFFFGTIDKKKFQNYKYELQNIQEYKLIEDLENQIHVNAGICNKKAKWFNTGMKLLLLTVILWFICSAFQIL